MCYILVGGEMFKLPCIRLIQSLMLWAGQPDKYASAYYISKYKNLILTLDRSFCSVQKLLMICSLYLRLLSAQVLTEGWRYPTIPNGLRPPLICGRLYCNFFWENVQKNLCKGPKSEIQNFGLKMTIPPLELFRKFIRIGSATLP